MTTTTKDGWIITRYSDRLVVQGPADDLGDERVEVYTRTDEGRWYRTYVEAGEKVPYANSEEVDGPPTV